LELLLIMIDPNDEIGNCCLFEVDSQFTTVLLDDHFILISYTYNSITHEVTINIDVVWDQSSTIHSGSAASQFGVH